MKLCSYSELTKKEVISCLDCTRLGYVVDLNINLENATIVSIVVKDNSGIFGFLKKNAITIPWDCVGKIGDDLIIVDYLRPMPLPSGGEKGGFFSNIFKK